MRGQRQRRRTVRVWDLTTRREQATLTGHTDWVRAVAVTAAAPVRSVVSTTGRCRRPAAAGTAILPPRPVVGSLAAPATHSPPPAAGGRPVGAGLGPAARARAGPHRPTQRLVWSVAITPDGKRAVSGGDDGSRTGLGPGRRPRAGHPDRPHPPGMVGRDHPGRHPRGQRQQRRVRAGVGPGHRPRGSHPHRPHPPGVVGRDHPGRHPRGQRQQRRVRAGLGPGRRPRAGHPHRPGPRQVFSVTITPDGNRAVSGSGNDLQVWDLAARRERATLTGHTREVWSVAITPDGKCAVSGSSDGIRAGLGPGLPARRGPSSPARPPGVRGGDHPRQGLAVSGGEDGTVQVWDVSAKTEVARWTGN